MESAVSDQVELSTPTVDVFVRENLFPDAISSSQERLAAAARTSEGLVAWGNTNTQVRTWEDERATEGGEREYILCTTSVFVPDLNRLFLI